MDNLRKYLIGRKKELDEDINLLHAEISITEFDDEIEFMYDEIDKKNAVANELTNILEMFKEELV